MNVESFYVYLLSNGSKQEYPSNSSSDFTNLIAKPIELDGEWEVALNEIIIPKLSEKDSTSLQQHVSKESENKTISEKDFPNVVVGPLDLLR